MMEEQSKEPEGTKEAKGISKLRARKLVWLPLAVALGVQYALVAPMLSPAEIQTLPHQAQGSTHVTYEITVSPQGQVTQSSAKPAQEQSASPAANAFLGAAASNPTLQETEAGTGQNAESTVVQQVQATLDKQIIAAKIAHKQAVQKQVEQLAAGRLSGRAKSISKLRVNGATISPELAKRLTSIEPDYALHIEYIDQNDVLPSGCEIVALTVVLHSMGYDNAKATNIADDYIEYGSDNKTQYSGSPYENGGCLSACIVNATNKWLDNGVEKQGDNSLKQSSDDDDDDDKASSDASSKSAEAKSDSSSKASSSSASNNNENSDSKSSASSSSKSSAAAKPEKSSSATAASKGGASAEKPDEDSEASNMSADAQRQAEHQRKMAKQIVDQLIAGGSPVAANGSASTETTSKSTSAESAKSSSASGASAKSKSGAPDKEPSASAASAASASAAAASKSASSEDKSESPKSNSSSSSKSSSSASTDASQSKESSKGSDSAEETKGEAKKTPALPIDDACAYDLTGTSYKDLCELVKLGYPVLVWTTEDMSTPDVWSTWYHPEHCVVLYGFKGDDALVSDSLAGLVKRNSKRFGEIYETVGKRAAFICPKASSQ